MSGPGVDRWQRRPAEPVKPEGPPIQLVSEGHKVPFSKGLLATALTATGLSPQRAYAVAMDVEWRLLAGRGARGRRGRLCASGGEGARRQRGAAYLRRYRMWNRMAAEDRPVIVLIGGATGVGKSTIAAQVARAAGDREDHLHRLHPGGDAGVLLGDAHAGHPLLVVRGGDGGADAGGPGVGRRVLGFMEQVEMVNVGVRAIIDRAIKERTSLVVEGVHMVPGMLGCRRRRSACRTRCCCRWSWR